MKKIHFILILFSFGAWASSGCNLYVKGFFAKRDLQAGEMINGYQIVKNKSQANYFLSYDKSEWILCYDIKLCEPYSYQYLKFRDGLIHYQIELRSTQPDYLLELKSDKYPNGTMPAFPKEVVEQQPLTRLIIENLPRCEELVSLR